ncbi:hypothetical protein CFP59_04455 [Streptomyces malaysiensis subsp. malaysiensis]|nr:hypothetical protein CFP59_04455 [Streptomyces sp. M56]
MTSQCLSGPIDELLLENGSSLGEMQEVVTEHDVEGINVGACPISEAVPFLSSKAAE